MPKTDSRVRSTGATRLAAVVLLTAALAACSRDSTGPGHRAEPGIEPTAGAGISDTVGAIPLQALVVTVRGPDAKPVAGAVVRFESVITSGSGVPVTASMLVSPLTGVNWGYLVADSTDDGGEASVRVRLGTVAGSAGVVVSVPELGYQDTVRYTVEPGQPAHIQLAPRDTAVFVGGAYSLRSGLTDRYGNDRPEEVELSSPAPEASVDGAGRVEGSAPARARIVASYGSLADTVWASFVPEGSLVSTRAGRLLFVNLDGSNEREVDSSVGNGMYRMQWLPGGEEFVALLYGNGNGFRNDGYRVKQSGEATPLLGDAALDALGGVTSFRVTPDGESAFVAATCDYAYGSVAYEIDLASGKRTRLSPDAATESAPCEGVRDYDPSPSPDGTRVVLKDGPYEGTYAGPLTVVDVATRKRTPLGVQGAFPVWSPAGDLIAYSVNDQVFVVKPDGTGARAVTPGARYAPVVSWSPDGKWLFMRQQYSSLGVQMLRVEDGLLLTLPVRVDVEPGMRTETF
jgi:hypothetical protein